VRPGELPPGLAPVDEPGVASMLPDGLARQAAVSFRRDAIQASEPGVQYVRQVVLAFDEREAVTYAPRFRDLMVRHQGYTAAGGDESEFRLTRTRGDESSAVVGTAHGEVLVVTTVAGLAGTVGPDDAARLTGVAIARIPTVDRLSAALSTDPGNLTLANAQIGPGHLDIPNQQDAARWPQPVQNLPGPPPIEVVQARSSRPVGDASLNVLMPVPQKDARPMANGTSDLVQFTRTLGPLLSEFWSRALAMTDVDYLPPRLVVVPDGQVVATRCLGPDGEPAVADGLFYCPKDETIYVHEPMMRDDLIAGADWRSRDYVIATVISHEWGHHIQKLTGLHILSGVFILNQQENWPLISRQRELQADCFAGLFTRYARDRGWLNAGDLNEAREAMIRAGDDALDHVDHHGTPEQRKEWFTRGYVHYAFRSCEPW
jgi:predicted metalloprotease